MSGLFNARDLGGLPAADGREVAAGRLYRAEVVTDAADPGIHSSRADVDIAAVAALGVRTVIDLRGPHEARTTPSAWAEMTGAHSALSLPIEDGGHGAPRDYVEMLLTGRLERFTAEDMANHYIQVLEARAEVFGIAVEAIAKGAPALVHCTEGKDRTGLLIALVLGALGTPAPDIVEDYALTSVWRPDRARAYASHFEAAGVAFESFRVLYESPGIAMRMAIDHVDREYGSVAEYVSRRGGVDEGTLVALREALLVPVD